MRTDDVASARLWKAGWSLVMAAALAACGGGGGGGPKNDDDDVGTTPDPPGLSYTGITTAATLSANTTPHITGALLFELGLATAQRPLPASFAANRAPGAITFLGKARHRISKQTTPRMESISNEPCAQGGTVQIDDRTDNRGIGTVILTYNACVEDGARTDGTLSLRVDAFDLVNNVPTDFTGTFQNFSITEGTFITDVAGTAHTVATSTSITDTYNTVTRYRPEGVMHRYQNMVVRTTPHPQSFSDDVVNVTGRFFHSAHGYVDVETRVPLRVNVNSGSLSDGTLRLRGAGVVTADVGFEQFGNVALSLDENGDSVVDRALRVARSALLSTTNFPPFAHAGPDATVPEGHTLTLDGSGSNDWEGNPLTYQWVVQSGPSGSGTVLGTQQRVDFRPMTPGTYVIQLNVTDGQPNNGFDTMTLTVLDNLAPVARAGLDVLTVERAAVTLDGSNSTDPEGDPLTYQWTLTSGPSGNNAPQTSTGATLSFMPDRPGTYVYRLRASDPFGFSEDVVTISADHLVSVGPLNISVDSRTTSAEATRTLQVTVSSRYSGPPVALAASTNVAGLRVVSISGQTGPSATVVVSADTTALQSIDNGLYEGLLTVTPAGGYTPSHSFASHSSCAAAGDTDHAVRGISRRNACCDLVRRAASPDFRRHAHHRRHRGAGLQRNAGGSDAHYSACAARRRVQHPHQEQSRHRAADEPLCRAPGADLRRQRARHCGTCRVTRVRCGARCFLCRLVESPVRTQQRSLSSALRRLGDGIAIRSPLPRRRRCHSLPTVQRCWSRATAAT